MEQCYSREAWAGGQRASSMYKASGFMGNIMSSSAGQ